MRRIRVILALGAGFLLQGALLEGTSLAGRITADNGDPPQEIQLVVVRASTAEQVRAVNPDSQGVFSLPLGPGDFLIFRGAPEEGKLITQVNLKSGENRYLEIRLAEGRTEVRQETRIAGDADWDVRRRRPNGHEDHEDEDPGLILIREFQIRTAELGRVSGGNSRSLADVVNPFPQQRKRRVYGSLYQFHRNDRFDARNFFDPVGQRRPPYRRNQFGLTLGAALSDKLDFFASYEGLRILRGSTLLSHVPTPAQKQGDFSRLGEVLRDPVSGQPFADNRIPDARIHPVSRRLLSLYPDPNRDDPDRNFLNSNPVTQDGDSISGRLDYQISPRAKLFTNYSLSDGERINVDALPAFGSTRVDRSHRASISYSLTFSPGLVGRLQLLATRRSLSDLSENADRVGLVESLGILGLSVPDPSEEGYPDMILSGYANLGDGSSPVTSVNNRVSLDNSWTYVRDNHTLRLGGEMEVEQLNNYRSNSLHRGRFAFSGSYTGDSFADFLLGIPNSASRGVGDERSDLRGGNWQLWIRDEWKLNPGLDLSLGLTYNYFQPYRSAHDDVSVLYPLLVEPLGPAEVVLMNGERARQLGLDRAGSRGVVFPSLNDWSPRIGFAFSPLASRRLVIRSSYGIHYSPLSSSYFRNYMGRNYPFYFVETAQASVESPELDLSDPFESASAAPTEQDVRGIEPDLNTAKIQRWRFSLQNAVAQNWNLEVAYSGGRGTHLPRVLPGNIPLPGPGPIQPRRPNPDFGRYRIVSGSGAYTDHALEAEAERRLSDGVAFKSGLIWRRQFNDTFRSNPANPRHLEAERGPSDFVPVRRFFLNYIVDLPFGRSGRFVTEPRWIQWLVDGWRLSGITHIQDGTPFSVSLGEDLNNDGLSGERPDRIGPVVLPPSDRSVDAWFAADDFALPESYAFGNAGRNFLLGPPYRNWDVSLVKRTRLQDGNLLEFRVEFFNAFNHVNFHDPNSTFGTSLFGKVFGASRSREIELAVKFSF